jgi:hypothetical protein
MQLYTDEPVKVSNCSIYLYQPQHIADQADNPEAWPQKMHAKAYITQMKKDGPASIWVGSANFTSQALIKKVGNKQGCNIELMVRADLTKSEVSSLKADLENKNLFVRCTALRKTIPRRSSPPSRPIATVISCELVQNNNGIHLVVHSTQKSGNVFLVNMGRPVRIPIKNGRGCVDGAKLRDLIPDVDCTIAQAIVIYQIVNKMRIPIIANIPHVPPIGESGESSQRALDVLLDDLLGRVRAPRRSNSNDDGDDGPGVNDQGETDIDEMERRLDEVKHQGELDQFAVKTALLKRLIVNITSSGEGRTGMLQDILDTLLKLCPPHLTSTIKSHFI